MSTEPRPGAAGARPKREAMVPPIDGEDLADVADIIDMARKVSGYAPTSLRVMARKPAILRAFAGLRDAVMRSDGEVPASTRWLAAHAVSQSAGCRYCQAHTAANGNKAGLSEVQIQAIPAYESDPSFTGAERAVIAFGLAAGQVPNEVGEGHFDALREHFSDEGIVELVAVISLFGWLNRWNDTLGSALEDSPRAFAEANLGGAGWSIGKHGGV